MSSDRSFIQVVLSVKMLMKCFAAFIFLAVAALVITVCVENWRGKRAWEQCKLELEAKGEHLDTAYFIPPPVPDDQNFAMTPLFKPLLDYSRDPKTDKAVFREPNPPVKKIRVDVEDSKIDKPSGGGWMLAKRKDLPAWQSYYRATLPETKLSESPAENVLTALGRFDTQLAEIRNAATARPASRFPLKYEEGMDTQLFHCDVLQKLEAVLALRATAELDLNRTDDAFADILLGFRLIESIQTEPLTVSALVRISNMAILIQPIWEGTVSHRWTTNQLEILQERLRKFDFLSDYVLAMRTERANINLTWDKIRTDPKWFKGMLDLMGANDAQGRSLRIIESAFSGWMYQDQAFQNHFVQENLLPIVAVKNQRVDLAVAIKGRKILAQMHESHSPYKLLARFTLPVLGSVSAKFVQAQTYANETMIACAIEQYRVIHGALPAKLDDLHMVNLPHDIINGEPLRYRVTGEDNYLLYSVGWNGVDDGGKVALKKNGTPDGEKGDWVWTLKPL